jgi:hypothetical protein
MWIGAEEPPWALAPNAANAAAEARKVRRLVCMLFMEGVSWIKGRMIGTKVGGGNALRLA